MDGPSTCPLRLTELNRSLDQYLKLKHVMSSLHYVTQVLSHFDFDSELVILKYLDLFVYTIKFVDIAFQNCI